MTAAGTMPQAKIDGRGREGLGRNAKLRTIAATAMTIAGQPVLRNSANVESQLVQSPAIARPRIKPAASRNAAWRMPVAISRSTAIASAGREIVSTISQSTSQATVATNAGKIVVQIVGPAPTLHAA